VIEISKSFKVPMVKVHKPTIFFKMDTEMDEEEENTPI
jgi:hypothetical protein